MKHICKIASLENLPEFRPLIAMDSNGDLTLIPAPKPQPFDEIWYTSSNGEIVWPLEDRPEGSLPKIVSNEIINGKGIIKFEENLTTIGERAFYDCDYLTAIEIPTTVTTIGESAFESCSYITRLVIPSSITSIGRNAFHYAGGHSGGGEEELPPHITFILESTTPIVLTGLTSGTYDLQQFGTNEKSLLYTSDAIVTILVPASAYQAYISSTDIGWVYYRENIQSY